MPKDKRLSGCCGEDFCGSDRCVAVVMHQTVHNSQIGGRPDAVGRTGSQHAVHKEKRAPLISLHTAPRWTLSKPN